MKVPSQRANAYVLIRDSPGDSAHLRELRRRHALRYAANLNVVVLRVLRVGAHRGDCGAAQDRAVFDELYLDLMRGGVQILYTYGRVRLPGQFLLEQANLPEVKALPYAERGQASMRIRTVTGKTRRLVARHAGQAWYHHPPGPSPYEEGGAG